MQQTIYRLAVNFDFRHIFIDGFTEENQAQCQAQWADFLTACERFSLTPLSYPAGADYRSYVTALEDPYVCLHGSDALALLAAFPTQVFIKQLIKVELDPAEVFNSVSSKAEAAFVGGQAVYNTKCDVHMPGSMLASYNEVQLLEDSCTDQVQASLAAGWRLIAVCPQPDQRRPDYVLGRFNPEYDGQNRASRGE